jgi:hypothetical protein
MRCMFVCVSEKRERERKREKRWRERSRTIPPNSINTLNGAEEKDESRAQRGTKRAKERWQKQAERWKKGFQSNLIINIFNYHSSSHVVITPAWSSRMDHAQKEGK